MCRLYSIVSSYHIFVLFQLAKQHNGTYIDASAKKKQNIDQVHYSAFGQFHRLLAIDQPLMKTLKLQAVADADLLFCGLCVGVGGGGGGGG